MREEFETMTKKHKIIKKLVLDQEVKQKRDIMSSLIVEVSSNFQLIISTKIDEVLQQ